MARAGRIKGPAQQLEELHRERVRIAGERGGLEAELTAAQRVISEFPDRQKAALVDAARGRGDAVGDVEAEARTAQAVIAALTPRIEALRRAEADVGEEVDAVKSSDEGIRYLTLKAEEASREAEAARAPAEDACAALKQAWMGAESAWGEVRRAFKHRRDDESAPAEVPRPDIGGPISSMDGHKAPWPGGKEQRYREAAQHATGRTSLTPSEVRAQLIEVAG